LLQWSMADRLHVAWVRLTNTSAFGSNGRLITSG
jgi:hypothetical protein